MQSDVHPLVSARIRRQYLGISADDMAKRLGIKRTSYLRFERGERRVYLDHSIAIATMLGCKVDDLNRMPSPSEVSELYADGQRRRSSMVSDETGEIIAPPAEQIEHLVNEINKMGQADGVIVVDAHEPQNNTTSEALADALAGWDDSE